MESNSIVFASDIKCTHRVTCQLFTVASLEMEQLINVRNYLKQESRKQLRLIPLAKDRSMFLHLSVMPQ